jgi:tetratricopeptide (TPR) repeat protein
MVGGGIGAYLYLSKKGSTTATNTTPIPSNTTTQIVTPPVTPTPTTTQTPIPAPTPPPANPTPPTPNEDAFQKALARAQAAEALGDYPTAATAYAEANAIKFDPKAAQKKEEMLAKAKAETDYLSHLQAGDLAMKINDFNAARQSYLKALSVKPSSPVPGQKMQEVDAREAFQRGVAAQGRGDNATATAEFNKALQLNPTLKPEVEQRMALNHTPTTPTTPATPVVTTPPANTTMPASVISGIDQLVRDGNTSAAIRRAEDSLTQYPSQTELVQAKSGLTYLSNIEKIRSGLTTTTTNALSTVSEARGLDSSDSTARNLKDYLEDKRSSIADKERMARSQYLEHRYDEVLRTLDGAKAIARDTGSELDNAQASYIKKAEEAENFVGVKVGPFSVGKKNGDKKKAEAYRRIAKDFDTQSEEAKALGR